jgi:hypothetical protein
MTPPAWPDTFSRDTNGTEADWRYRLPGACGEHTLRWGAEATRSALVLLGPGQLELRWELLPPRRIALISLPRLLVHYHFSGLDAGAKAAFMRYFDLFMQRGGG